MNYIYLGEYSDDIKAFVKRVDHNQWKQLKKSKKIAKQEKILKYFTVDRVFICNLTTGEYFTEKYDTPKLEKVSNIDCLQLTAQRQKLPFFPSQFKFLNKQVIDVYETENGIYFTDVKERGTSWVEIYTHNLDTIPKVF